MDGIKAGGHLRKKKKILLNWTKLASPPSPTFPKRRFP